MSPHELRRFRHKNLDIYHASPLPARTGAVPLAKSPVFVKIKNKTHDLEVYLRILLLISPLLVLLIRVYFLDIPLMPDSPQPGDGTGINILLAAAGSACLMPLLFIVGHDPELMVQLSEQWLLIFKDELIHIDKCYCRVFVPFARRYHLREFKRNELSRLALTPYSDCRRAGGTCFNPEIAARFISWNLQINAHSKIEISLGDIGYESAAELHKLLRQWISEETRLEPLPPRLESGDKPSAAGL